MSREGMAPDALWTWALADASGVDDVVLIDVGAVDDPEWYGRFMPPGDREVDLPAEQVQKVNAEPSRPRVVLPLAQYEGDPPALLAVMRHHLEYAVVLRASPAVYDFSLSVAAALYPVYQHAGRGGAVIYNAIPMMQSANAAAGRLVGRRLGPQFERLDDRRFGALFRTDDAPVPIGELPLHSTTFAAIWAEAVDAQFETESRVLDDALQSMARAAPEWWTALRGDDTFRALALGAATYRPTPAEQRLFHDHPARAWQTARSLVRRATSYGIAMAAAGLLRGSPAAGGAAP